MLFTSYETLSCRAQRGKFFINLWKARSWWIYVEVTLFAHLINNLDARRSSRRADFWLDLDRRLLQVQLFVQPNEYLRN